MLQSAVMASWTAQSVVAGSPDDVLQALTEPDVIAQWAPIEFELVDHRCDRLRAGDRVRVRGFLAGRCLEFTVHVYTAQDGCLRLSACGPIDLDVEYLARPLAEGSVVRASVQVTGRGLIGRVLAQATDALLAAGALGGAIARIGRELDARSSCGTALEPALAA